MKIKLSSIFNCNRDADISFTHYANSILENTICFVLNLEYLNIANENNNISAIITTENLSGKVNENKGLIISTNPKEVFFYLHNKLLEEGLNKLNVSSKIGENVKIAHSVKIGENVKIGNNVIIEDYSVINSNTIIEDDTYIGSHCVIGARGMHNTKIGDKFINVTDVGGVHIGKNCEVLSSAIVQKSYFAEFTKIGDGSKISVGVNIGHGSIVGENTMIAGYCQVSGYNTIGNDVWIGPSSTLSHGLNIGNNVNIKIGSVVVKNLKDYEEVSGNFAYNHLKKNKKLYKGATVIEKINVDFSFKGTRNYVHGTDIFNKMIELLKNDIKKEKIDLSFHGVAKTNIFLLKNKPEKENLKFVFKYINRSDEKKILYAVENNNSIKDRYDYPEEDISKVSTLFLEEEKIVLTKNTSYSFVENTVALNKYLLENLFPNKEGKWYFTRFQLDKIPPEIYPLRLELKSNFNFKLTKTEIFVNDESIGFIYFSLV